MRRGRDPLLAVEVLGPVRGAVRGEPMDLNRVQVRRLLAMLAARGGLALSVDDAIEGLWPDDQPADPRAAFRVVLSRLRTTLGDAAEALVSEANGLRLEASTNDLVAFTDLIDRARDAEAPRQAADLLGEALALRRDRPFVDTTGPPILDDACRSIDDAMWFARTRLVEALHELEEHEAVVERATAWHAAEPHRERLAVDLARSLAVIGRKATALETLEASRTHLREQFGVDPGPEFVAAEHGILTGAVQLGSPPAGRLPLAAERSPVEMVGREAELDRLLRAEGTVVVTGEPGIGKSILVDAFTRRRRDCGVPVTAVVVDESLHHPLEPIADLLRDLLGGDLDAVEPGLRRRVFPERSDDDGPAVAVTRETLVRGCADLFAAHVPTGGVTLVVDDGHWIDSLSAEVLLAVHHEQIADLVIGARRGSIIDGLFDGAEHVDLEPLTADDIGEMLARDVPRLADSATVTELTTRSGGNPLFAQLLIDLLAEGTDAVEALPSSVLVAVQKRLDDLRRRTVRALEVAAALGQKFSVTHFAGLRPDDLDALDEAVEAQLLELDGSSAHFIHALIAEGIGDLTPPARRIDLHDEIGRFLEASGEPPAVWAEHYAAAEEVDPGRAVGALVAAGRDLVQAFTWDLARARFEEARAIHVRHHRPDDLLAARALVGLGRVLRITASPSSVATLSEGAEMALDLDESVLFARAVTELCRHGDTTAAGMVDDRAGDLLAIALKLELPSGVRAQLCAAAATLLAVSEQWELSRSLYLEAFETAAELEDPDVVVDVLMEAHLGLGHPDDFDHRLHAAEHLLELGPNDPDVCWEATFLRMGSAMVVGDGPTMWASLDQLRDLTPRVVTRSRAFGLAFMEAAAAITIGDHDLAEDHLERALVEGLARYPENWVMLVYSSILMGIRHAQGRVDELSDAVERLLTESPEFPTWRVMAAVAAANKHDMVLARRHWAELRRIGPDGLVPDISWTAAMGFMGRLAVQLEDEAMAQQVYDRLLPIEDRMLWAGTCTYGPCSEVLALIDDFLGRPAEAKQRWASAEEMERRLQQRDSL